MRHAARSVAAAAAAMLLATACGARLTDEQRELAIQGSASAGVGQQSPGTEDGSGVGGAADVPPSATATGRSDQDAPQPGAAQPSGDPTDASGEQAESGGGEAGSPDASTENGSGGDGSGGQPAWRTVPAGGNGGETDVGVTEGAITLANVSDISGAVPGLFEDAQMGAAAYVAYHNATQGPIYGRSLEYLPLDSRMDSNGNRQQYLRACDEAFAVAGSMTGFEEGVAAPVRSCGIPDVRTSLTSTTLMETDNAFAALPIADKRVGVSQHRYWREQYPEAIKDAASLAIDTETTREATDRIMAATKTLGYEWDYVQRVQVAETNYSGFVLDMKEQGIEFVTFQGPYQNAVRLAQAMQQQDFEPEVFALETNMYDPGFIESGGEAVEGTEIAIFNTPVEELGDNPEGQRYVEWLQQVAPDQRPTSFGMLAWSATALLVEGLKEVGPEPTRAELVEHLRGIETWDGNGLHAPERVGEKLPSGCSLILTVRDGEFRRLHPDSGFRCESLVDL